jgi:hypothetical protein
LGLTFQVGFFFRPALCLNGLGPLDTETPLTGDHGYYEYNGDHADTPWLHAYDTFSHVYPLDLFLLRWPFFDIENVSLELVARR